MTTGLAATASAYAERMAACRADGEIQADPSWRAPPPSGAVPGRPCHGERKDLMVAPRGVKGVPGGARSAASSPSASSCGAAASSWLGPCPPPPPLRDEPASSARPTASDPRGARGALEARGGARGAPTIIGLGLAGQGAVVVANSQDDRAFSFDLCSVASRNSSAVCAHHGSGCSPWYWLRWPPRAVLARHTKSEASTSALCTAWDAAGIKGSSSAWMQSKGAATFRKWVHMEASR
mmetsp:Transcript_6069/g.17172  ORF Transcript_6069/g.17172 Transcript_6069/m.17172 type:complete len:237 (+) Transcript_6069:725-1435(+)